MFPAAYAFPARGEARQRELRLEWISHSRNYLRQRLRADVEVLWLNIWMAVARNFRVRLFSNTGKKVYHFFNIFVTCSVLMHACFVLPEFAYHHSQCDPFMHAYEWRTCTTSANNKHWRLSLRFSTFVFICGKQLGETIAPFSTLVAISTSVITLLFIYAACVIRCPKATCSTTSDTKISALGALF